MATSSDVKNTITLKGSAQIVTEFFGYSINSILYQRGIYPPDSFSKVPKYGLQMFVTKEEGLKNYLSQVLMQLTDWLLQKTVQQLVLVVTSVDTAEVLERWVFNIQSSEGAQSSVSVQKPEKEIMSEIQALMRQIISCVTFLPNLSDPCTFELLVYTNKDAQVPKSWEESEPKFITNSDEVKLRSFTTKIHKVSTMVAYKIAQS